jgi:ABC-type transporter Mla MlaB component
VFLTGTRFALCCFRFEEAGVLRITRLSPKGRGLTLKLEGEVLGAWVGATREACATPGRRPRRLDLAAVTYVDAAGVQLLCELMAEGVEIAACSSFVRELLHLES